MLDKTPNAIIVALALVLAATGLTTAASIKDQLTERQISTFCLNQAVGSDVDASATTAGGAFVSGSVRCESNDVTAPSPSMNQSMNSTGGDDDSGRNGNETGESHGSDDHGSDNGDDHGSDHGNRGGDSDDD